MLAQKECLLIIHLWKFMYIYWPKCLWTLGTVIFCLKLASDRLSKVETHRKLQSCPPFKHNAQCSEPTCSATKCGKNNINFFNPSHPDRIHPFAWSTFHTHYCVNFSKRLSLSVGNGKCRATKSCTALTTLSCGTERIKHGELLATSTNLSYFSAIGNISLYSVCATS